MGQRSGQFVDVNVEAARADRRPTFNVPPLIGGVREK